MRNRGLSNGDMDPATPKWPLPHQPTLPCPALPYPRPQLPTPFSEALTKPRRSERCIAPLNPDSNDDMKTSTASPAADRAAVPGTTIAAALCALPLNQGSIPLSQWLVGPAKTLAASIGAAR